MKKYISIILLSAFCVAFAACDEDTMDEINVNKNNPTDMQSKFILTDVMTSTAFNCTGSVLAFYASCYIEHNVGISGQLYNAEIRTSEPISSSTYNNEWVSLYTNLANLKVCLEKCKDGGEESGNYHGLGMAQVLTAYNLALLTDLFGDIPWSEALQPGVIYTPKIDSQESVYNEIFTLLDAAIDNFSKECGYSLGSQDFFYGGDVKKWTKFAYGLKARYTMRLLYRASDKNAELNKVIEFADKSFESAENEAKFAVYDGKSATSPFYQFYKDRNYFGASQSFADLLASKSDPRGSVLFKAATQDGSATDFAPNGRPKEIQDSYAISAISTPTAPTYLLSYHELEFLKAEAYARLGNVDEAKVACGKAITAALHKVNINVEDDAISAYVAKIQGSMNTSTAVAEVSIQKYIAFYEEEAVEAYNDIRRWKALGESNITLAHPNPDKFPLRFTYGNGDVTTNPNVYNAFSNTNVFTDNVWWAGGSH